MQTFLGVMRHGIYFSGIFINNIFLRRKQEREQQENGKCRENNLFEKWCVCDVQKAYKWFEASH